MANVTISGSTLTTPAGTDLLPMQRPASATNRHITVASLGGVSLTWSAAQTFGAGVTLSSTLTANGAISLVGATGITGGLTVTKNFTYPSTYPTTFTGSGTTDTAPMGLVQFVNPIDGTGTRYNGEVHLYLRAGASRNERRYLNFRKYDDSGDDWIIGANASDVWIKYDGVAHREWFIQGGASYFNAAGDGGVIINYHPTDAVGKYFAVYSGGNTPHAVIFQVGYNTPGNKDTQLNLIVNAGDTAAQNAYLIFQDRGSAKFYFGKHSTNGFALYDLTNSRYSIFVNTSGYMGIGHISPVSLLHASLTDAGTNTITNIGALGHSSSGTPAAGFGTGLLFLAESASVDGRNLGRLYYEWVDATDATRAGKGRLTAYYTTTERTALSWAATSSEAQLGFFATAPAGKQTVTGSKGGNAALDSLLDALVAYGLITDSTS